MGSQGRGPRHRSSYSISRRWAGMGVDVLRKHARTSIERRSIELRATLGIQMPDFAEMRCSGL